VLGRQALQVELGIEDAREVLIVTERGARVYAKTSPTKMRSINICTAMPQPQSGIAVSGHHYFAVPALRRRHATSTATRHSPSVKPVDDARKAVEAPMHTLARNQRSSISATNPASTSACVIASPDEKHL